MHPAIIRYLQLKEELEGIAKTVGRAKGLSPKEIMHLEQDLGCPYCAKEMTNQPSRWYKVICKSITDILKGNGLDVSAVVDQLNKRGREMYQKKYDVAIVNEDGNIDFINGCTNGISDILPAAAELIQ